MSERASARPTLKAVNDAPPDPQLHAQPVVAVIMGSRSDWPTMQHACAILDELHIPYEARVISAHRTPDRLYTFARTARDRGLKVIIAGAGGAAHLPGMTAALTPLPVFGVPVRSRILNGEDSLLSIVQMPGGVPVGTLAIGRSGAINAALLSASVLALMDDETAQRLDAWRAAQTHRVDETVSDSSAVSPLADTLIVHPEH